MTTLIISVHLEKFLSKRKFVMDRTRLVNLTGTIIPGNKPLVKFKFIKDQLQYCQLLCDGNDSEKQ